MKSVLIASSDTKALSDISKSMSARYSVDTAETLSKFSSFLQQNPFDFILLDFKIFKEALLSGKQEMLNIDTQDLRDPLNSTPTLAETRKIAIKKVEKDYLEMMLAIHLGKINKTSEAAGISSRQLRKLLTKHGIQKKEFKTLQPFLNNAELRDQIQLKNKKK